MDLRDRKIINNAIPKYEEGKLLHMPTGDGWGQTATGAIGFAGATMGAFGPVKSTSDILGESGTSVGQGSGFTYQKQNPIDAGAQMDELGKENTANTLKTAATGASLGATFGPIGAGIGSIVGGAVGFIGGLGRKSKMAERIKQAQIQADLNNNYNMASGQSDYLATQYNINHNYSQSGQIYGAKDGKMPGVKLPEGLEPNAMVSNGEIIGHVDAFGNVIDAQRVGHGKDNKDTIPVHLAGGKQPSKNSFVITNKNGISDYVAATGDVIGGLEMQKNMKDFDTVKQLYNNPGLFAARNGMLPKFKSGKTSNITPPEGYMAMPNFQDTTIKPKGYSPQTTSNPSDMLGIFNRSTNAEKNDFINRVFENTGIGSSFDTDLANKIYSNSGISEDGSTTFTRSPWSEGVSNAIAAIYGLATSYGMKPKGPLSTPSTYVADQNASQVGNVLASLRANTAAQREAARSAEARNRYTTKMMGTGAGSYLPAAIASNIGLQRLNANIEAEGNRENNQYKANWGQYWGNVGLQGANRAQQALIHDYDARSRAHGAMIQQANMSSLNELAQIQQYLKNLEAYRRFNRTMAYYDSDYQLRRDALNKGWGGIV